MARKFVLGDIHGAKRALDQVLERCGFNNDADTLIFLGDISDGWPEVKQSIDKLLTIKNLVHLRGNHDDWFLDAVNGEHPGMLWLQQGGYATVNSYNGLINVLDSHKEFLRNAKLYHEDDGRIFVHAGWPGFMNHPMQYVSGSQLFWDRSMWHEAVSKQSRKDSTPVTKFKEVFIGHTPTIMFDIGIPMNRCEIWNVDTGAGYGFKLSIMDVDTKEYWQSDNVQDLYPGVKGR
jgi:serine/threonine protein phosphatase 1